MTSTRLLVVGFSVFAAVISPVAAQQKSEKSVVSTSAASTQAAATPAAVGAEPEITTATYGDWTLRCQRAEDGGAARICEISHSVQVQGQAGPILQLAVGKPVPGQDQQLIIALPANVLVTAPAEVETEGNPKPVKATWRRCIVGACVSDVEFKALAGQLLAAERGTVKFTDAANRPVSIPFSLRGLKQALDALGKS